jgi:hypothetical protein
MSEPRALQQNPNVLFTELDDGTGVLLHLDTKFYFALNRTGVFVWKAVRESPGCEAPALAKKLTEAFRVDIETATRDIDSIVAEMLADDLLLPAAP